MSRTPFDPMNTAAMRAAKARKKSPLEEMLDPSAPPLPADEERKLIEATVAAQQPSLLPDPTLMAAGGSPTSPWSVAEVNACINQLLTRTLPNSFFIAGEISNFKTYDRGHGFFTLKDASAELPCIMWKDALNRLKFRPKDGMAVIARGSIKLYEPQGKIQLYVEEILPRGAGALELAFRQLCDKLKAEGLFEPSRKRKIPRLPQRIAIITSKTGDVLHDVLTTAHRRYPGLHILLCPVRVQGESAAPDIIRAIQQINRLAEKLSSQPLETRNSKLETLPIDLILLVRGGGSLEDLWAFNDEALARAIVASTIPIATGIGHEPDTTIADLVGDLRGPTPTGITELTIPSAIALRAEIDALATVMTRDIRRTTELAATDLHRLGTELTATSRDALRTRIDRIHQLTQLIERIEPRHAIAQGWRRVEESQRRLNTAIHTRLRTTKESLTRTTHRLDRASPVSRLPRLRDHLTHLERRLESALTRRTQTAHEKLTALATQLRIISPLAILDRGYSITTKSDGTILRKTADAKKGDILTTRLPDGTLESTVGKPKQASLF